MPFKYLCARCGERKAWAHDELCDACLGSANPEEAESHSVSIDQGEDLARKQTLPETGTLHGAEDDLRERESPPGTEASAESDVEFLPETYKRNGEKLFRGYLVYRKVRREPGELEDEEADEEVRYLAEQERDWVCDGLLKVDAFIRNEQGHHFYVVSFFDLQRNRVTVQFPWKWKKDMMLASLREMGLVMSDTKEGGDAVVTFIKECGKKYPINTTTQRWYKGRFMTHSGPIGPPLDERIQLDESVANELVLCGSHEHWKLTIGAMAIGNPFLVFCICAALLSVVLSRLKLPNICFHIAGGSSLGKSLALFFARSVTGTKACDWNMSPAALGVVALNSNDLLITVDEMGQADAHTIGPNAYLLGNGKTKGRYRNEQEEFRTVVLSAGELSPREFMAESGHKQMAGQEVRMPSMRADLGQGMGTFLDIHGYATPKEFAEAGQAFSLEDQGHTMYFWLSAFTSDPDHEAKFNEYKRTMEGMARDNFQLANAAPMVGRVLSHFASVGALGEMAIANGTLPWPEGESFRQALFLFDWWLRDYAPETTTLVAGVERVFAFLENNRVRFCERVRGAPPVNNLAGYHDTTADGDLFYVRRDVWRDEVCVGSDAEQMAERLKKKGYLIHDVGRLTKKADRRAEPGQDNFYCVRVPGKREGREEREGNQEQEANAIQRSYSLPPYPIPDFPFQNRAIFGDCIDLIKLLPNNSLDIVITSPPYAEQRQQYPGIAAAQYPEYTVAWLRELRPKLKENGSVLIVIRPHLADGQVSDHVMRTVLAVRDDGWIQPEELFWLKGDGLPAGSLQRPRRNFEHILWFSKTPHPYVDLKARARLFGQVSKRIGMESRNPHGNIHSTSVPTEGTPRLSDVIIVPAGSVDRGIDHPAMFPPELVRILVLTFCPTGGVVLDPFCGSGTTLLVAQSEGYPCVGFDNGAAPNTGEPFADMTNRRLREEPKYAWEKAKRERQAAGGEGYCGRMPG